MKKFTFKAPIEVRASSPFSQNPEYIIKGYLNANIPDNYGTLQMPDGSKKAMKSIFTTKGFNSLRRQAKSKKIMVDAQHKTTAKLNVEHFLEQVDVPQEIKDGIMRQVQIAELPLFKLNDITQDSTHPDRLIVDARMNPNYRLVDENHKNYFDAVWKSMQDKYINQVSFDFATTKVEQIDGIDRIDDLDLFGINFLGGGALPENQIFEVAMRATGEFNQAEGELKMKEENEKKAEELKTREAEVKKKEGEIKQVEETKQKETIEAEKAQQKVDIETIKKEVETLKAKKETEGKQGTVPQQENPNAPIGTGSQPNPLDGIDYQNKINKMFKDRIRTTKRFPNKEDMFGGAPRPVNPDGDIGLGEALVLNKENFDNYVNSMSDEERRKFLAAVTDESRTFAHTVHSKNFG